MLAVGVGLRAWQVFYNAPLWLDELALTNGILSGSFVGLFDGASDFAQSAPSGFLTIEWVIVQACSPVPTSPFAFRRSSSRPARSSPRGWPRVNCPGSVTPGLRQASSRSRCELIFMSGQVKPYAADAFFAPAHPLRARCGTIAPEPRRSWRALFAAGAIGAACSRSVPSSRSPALAFSHAACVHRRSRGCRLFAIVRRLGRIGAASSVDLSRTGLLSPEADVMMAVYWTPWYPPFPPSSRRT